MENKIYAILSGEFSASHFIRIGENRHINLYVGKDEYGRTGATRQSTGTSPDKEVFYNTMYPGEVGDMVSADTGINGSYLNPDWAIGKYNEDNNTNWEISRFRLGLQLNSMYKIVYENN